MKNERVDEIIDRVAAELVEGHDDPTFTTRLREQLEAQRARRSSGLLLAASVCGVLIAAIVTFKFIGSSAEPTGTTERLAPVAPVAPVAPGAPVAPVAPSRTQSHLANAATLSVKPLDEIAPLEDVAVDVEALAVDALAVANLEESEKESR